MEISKNAIKEKFNRFVSWWALRVPGWLIYLALMLLASRAYFQFESGGNFSEVLTPYLTTIGLTIALASVIFSDARLKYKDEQEYLVSAGELLLYAAVNLILSLLVFWLASGAAKVVAKTPPFARSTPLRWLILIVFSSGNVFLISAALSLHRGLIRLERYLRGKYWQKELWKMPPP
jgi:cytochrome bd-type quinol oxidase subunit 2